MSQTTARPVSPAEHVIIGAGALVGAALRPMFAGVARARQTRALHPRGVVAAATLTVADHPPCGIDVLDTPGPHSCLVRLSRAVGTPSGSPDVGGLALRFPGGGGHGGDGDLLLASTGLGPLSRHVLAIRRRLDGGALGTLWPYLTPGSTMIAALPLAPFDESAPEGARFSVGWARGRGVWTHVGTLRVEQVVTDPPVRFDSVRNPLAGARQYPWVEAIRTRSYGGAREGWTSGQTMSMGR